MSNALKPILVTLAGMIMDIKLDVWPNASIPMLPSWEPSANVTVVNADANQNAAAPMLLTPAGMVIEVNLDA